VKLTDTLNERIDELEAQLRACKRENRILRHIAEAGCRYKSSSGNCFNRKLKVYQYRPCQITKCPLLVKKGGKS
jgi:hypothetical protein